MSSRSLLEHAERGPHPVGLLEREIRDSEDAVRRLPLDIWYPAEPGLRGRDLEPDPAPLHPFGQPHQALLGARPAAERFPLIAFSHGNSGLRRQSTFLTMPLAVQPLNKFHLSWKQDERDIGWQSFFNVPWFIRDPPVRNKLPGVNAVVSLDYRQQFSVTFEFR